MSFEKVSPGVKFAALGTMPFAWTTSGRMGGIVVGCRIGCPHAEDSMQTTFPAIRFGPPLLLLVMTNSWIVVLLFSVGASAASPPTS